MKYLIILFAITLSTTAFGQRADTLIIDLENQRQFVITTYYEDGSVRTIIYQSSRVKDDTTTVVGQRLGDMKAAKK